MKKKILFTLLLLSCYGTYATHNRAGEITYQHITGYTYKIKVTTYTKQSSTQADRCSLTVFFGDGDTAVFNRVNGPLGGLCGGTIPIGELVANDIKKNIYEGNHTFPGPNTYNITMKDRNRNVSICNLGNTSSDELSFFLKTVLSINSFLPLNNSPVFFNPPIDNGCVGQCFYHNPAAFDKEGDSLYYSLVPCYSDGVEIPGYQFPPGVTAQSIDHATGEFTWCDAAVSCQFNIAILVEEWKYVNGKYYFTGSVLRDMLIDIVPCQNKSPEMKKKQDAFVEVGNNFHYQVSASDPDSNN
jgi:hypothetical protein